VAVGSPCSMADRIRVTAVILASLPRGERLVSSGGGPRLAGSGPLDRRTQAKVGSARRTDTPTYAPEGGPARTCCSPIAARCAPAILTPGPCGGWRVPGSIAKALRRAFDAQEIVDAKQDLRKWTDVARSPRAMLPKILQLRQQGKSLSEIGRLLGFTHQSIGRALGGRKGASAPTSGDA
jgi:hypothetical protein